jgi:protein SCO1/2
MPRSAPRRSRCPLLLAAALTIGVPAGAQPLQQADIVERVGAAVPRDLAFTDSSGRRVRLGDLMTGETPIVLSLAYFTCPVLCHLGQDGLAEALRVSGWRVGPDVRVVSVSIDPRDTPAAARQWRLRAATLLAVPPDTMDWHDLVGDEPAIRRLADAVGFRYAYDGASGQYSHAAAVFVLTPAGRISRYVYGVTFEAATLDAALRAARANQGGGPFERFLMRCYHYVPALRRHGWVVVWMLRAGGVLVTAALASLLIVLWRREGRPAPPARATEGRG